MRVISDEAHRSLGTNYGGDEATVLYIGSRAPILFSGSTRGTHFTCSLGFISPPASSGCSAYFCSALHPQGFFKIGVGRRFIYAYI